MRCLALAACLLLAGCASAPHRDPLQVSLAGIERPQKGDGLEVRMTVKLRVQNPNHKAVAFNGVALQMEVAGKAVASGVSDVKGKVPGYGEMLVRVPVTISALGLAGQAMGILKTVRSGKVPYALTGKLGDGRSDPARFAIEGEMGLLHGWRQ